MFVMLGQGELVTCRLRHRLCDRFDGTTCGAGASSMGSVRLVGGMSK